MVKSDIKDNVLSTLLYYDIFDYPLSARELFTFFPKNSLSLDQFKIELQYLVQQNVIAESEGFFRVPRTEKNISFIRLEREKIAKRQMALAKVFTLIIKQFPFVRGVFLSGELSKKVASPDSDIDYLIVTAEKRLWITRTLLILFKKTVLFNSKRYFCLNYFVTEARFQLTDKSYYIATEIGHLKPLYNFPLFLKYINANGWIKKFFPNYSVFALTNEPRFETPGFLQKPLEFLLSGKWADRLDEYLMNKMRVLWRKRYHEHDESTHERLFKCSPDESRAFIGNFSAKIEALYEANLKSHNLHS